MRRCTVETSIDEILQNACHFERLDAPDILEHLSESQCMTLAASFHLLKKHRNILLYEATGTGKTYVATALAALYIRFENIRCHVIAPAHMMKIWEQVFFEFDIEGDFYSYQAASLDKIPKSERFNDLWILDEAHWLKNPATLRYQHLLPILAPHRLCLISATPVSMSWKDLESLMKFCGFPEEKSCHSDAWVRHFATAIIPQAYVPPLTLHRDFAPTYQPIEYDIAPCDERFKTMLTTLEKILWITVEKTQISDIPLLTQVIFHRLLSHRTSCLKTLDKLVAYYNACRLNPKGKLLMRSDFRALMGEEGKQRFLPFDNFLFGGVFHESDKNRLEADIQKIRQARTSLEGLCQSDDDKLNRLLECIASHPEHEKIVVFTQYCDTAHMIADFLYPHYPTALLTPSTSRLNRYQIDPSLIVTMFSSKSEIPDWWRNAHFPIPKILVCTDAFSCGQNFQAASMLIHFDLPWNPTTMKQREGRIMRLGQSAHQLRFLVFVAQLPETSFRDYQEKLIQKLSERQILQNAWFSHLPTLPATQFLVTDHPDLPTTWALCDHTWIPIHPQKCHRDSAMVYDKTTMEHAFASLSESIRRKFAPCWNALKRYAYPNDNDVRHFIGFVQNAAYYPQLQRCLPKYHAFTSQNIHHLMNTLRKFPRDFNTFRNVPAWLITACPQHAPSCPQ